MFSPLATNRQKHHISGMMEEINKQHSEKLGIMIGNPSRWKVKLMPSIEYSAFFKAFLLGTTAFKYFHETIELEKIL